MNTKLHSAVIRIPKQALIVTAALLAVIILTVTLFSIGLSHGGKRPRVCIDAGHGGDSIGAAYGNNERLEKDDNLKLALFVRAELEDMGASVIMTRKTDKTVSLQRRCALADTLKADYYICLHRNSSDNPEAKGTEMWISKEPTNEQLLLAENLLTNLEKVGISENRGIKQGFRDSTADDFYINSATAMTSCLVELGFISNSEDNKEYDKNIKKYASAIAKAIMDTYECT